MDRVAFKPLTNNIAIRNQTMDGHFRTAGSKLDYIADFEVFHRIVCELVVSKMHYELFALSSRNRGAIPQFHPFHPEGFLYYLLDYHS